MTFGVWLRLGRISNLPTVWTNTLAGSVLAGATVDGYAWTAGLCGAFSSFYVGGMYLNDAFDRDIDRIERPQRPIPAGVVRATTVFALGFGFLALGFGLAGWLARARAPSHVQPTFAAGAALAALIVLYDLFHKGNPLSPLLMGLCRVMVYVAAAFAASGHSDPNVYLGALALLSHLIGLTYAAKQENLAVIKNLWPLGFLAWPVGYLAWLGLSDPLALTTTALYAAWLVYSLSFLLRRQGRSIPGGVVRLIAGISLLDAALLAGHGAPTLALVAIVLCGVTRLGQRFVPGT